MSTPADRRVSAVVVHDPHDAGARAYARWTAEELGVASTTPAEVDPAALVVASTVIAFCGIDGEAGRGAGLQFVLDDWDALVGSGRRVAVAMVGLAPVVDQSRLDHMISVFAPEQLGGLKVFQLRGRLDVDSMGFRQKLAVKAAVQQVRALPRRTPDEQAMLDAGGRMDFTRRESLGPLLRWARSVG